MIGEPLPVFLCYLAHFMRQKRVNGVKSRMSINDLAEFTGEHPNIVRQILQGQIEPTHNLLKRVGWCKFDETFAKNMLVTETRYTTIERATNAEKEEE